MKIKKITAGILAMVMTLVYFCMGVSAETLEDQLLSVSYGSSTNSTISPIQRYVKDGKVYLTMDLSEAMKLLNKYPRSIIDEWECIIYGGRKVEIDRIFIREDYNFCIEAFSVNPDSQRFGTWWQYYVGSDKVFYSDSDFTFDVSTDGRLEFAADLSSEIGKMIANETDFQIKLSTYKKEKDEMTYFYGGVQSYQEVYLESEEFDDNTTKYTYPKIKNQTYTGKPKTPSIIVKDEGHVLIKGERMTEEDYIIYYENNTEIGTASVTIKGSYSGLDTSSPLKGSKDYNYNDTYEKKFYEGSKTFTFKIVPAKTTLTATRNSSKAALSWKSVKGAENYEIYYRKQGDKKYKKLTTVSSEKTSCSVSKLDKNSSYEFKVRSYATRDSEKYYSSYSNVVLLK